MLEEIIIGQVYRFKNDEASCIRRELKGKWFRVISHTRIEVYQDDGTVISNGSGDPWFTYTRSSIIRHISSVDIRPIERLNKFKFVC
jgi:carbamoylphosphate synthase small subunit